MTRTIAHLYRFQKNYLLKLVDNVSDTRLYELQLEGYNSAGWILGHIVVECEDVYHHLNLETPYPRPDWKKWFVNSTGKVTSLDGLPTKSELIEAFEARYDNLIEVYESLTEAQRISDHPSPLIKEALPDLDSWFAHHMVTHLAIDAGNIVVWKKMLGLEVGGY